MRPDAGPIELDQRDMWQLSRIFSLIALFYLGVTSAMAGERALVEVIGYSDGGRYFAFEEFGVQDGSGFAYSNIYLIDLDHDRWVAGTPLKRQAEDEVVSLSDLRTATRKEILPRLVDLDITRPAQTIALIGDGARGVATDKLAFGVPGPSGPGIRTITGEYKLFLESYTAETSEPCQEWSGDKTVGFSLTIKSSGARHKVHRDQMLPRSRGCPIDYHIYGVYLPFEDDDISRAVALISVFTQGFEGPDRRFIAVPLAFAL